MTLVYTFPLIFAVESVTKSTWTRNFFTPVAVVLVFNVADLSGRILGLRHVVLVKELQDIEFLLTRLKSLSVPQAVQ